MNRPRGQAVVETAIFGPLFFAMLVAVIWATREIVLQERMQSLLRYGSTVVAQSTAFNDIGFYPLYNNLHGTYSVGVTNGNVCGTLSSAALTATDTSGSAAATFYNPVVGANQAKTCTKRVGYGAFPGSPLIMLISTTSSVKPTQIDKSSIHALGALIVPQAGQTTAFRQPDMQSILRCFPDVHRVVSNSLAPGSGYAPAHGTAPLPNAFTPPDLAVNGSC